MPKTVSAVSCSSGGQASRACGPCLLPQPRASPASRPRMRLLANAPWPRWLSRAASARRGQRGRAARHPAGRPARTDRRAAGPARPCAALRGRLVENVQSLPERGAQPVPRRHGEGRPGGSAGRGTRVAAERGACRLGRGQPTGEISLHLADPPLVRLGVQPEAAWRAHRLQQAVGILPGPEHMVADPPGAGSAHRCAAAGDPLETP